MGAMKHLATVALVAATTIACTVQTKPSSEGASSPEGAPSAPAPTPGPGPAPGAGGAVPEEVVGEWTWVTGAGAQTVRFEADGTYATDVFLDGHPGESCGTEYFTHRAGVATFTDTTVRLRSNEARRKRVDSCDERTLADDAIDAQDETLEWRRTTDAEGAPVLVLERPGESATTYAAGS